MATDPLPFAALTDAALLVQVTALAERERHATADLIAALAELDARRLYLAAGCSSLFTYCTQVLHLSEHAAYGRIEAARATRRFPEILERLADGRLTMTAVCLLSAVLTGKNHAELLDAARHATRREVERLVARVRPQPEVRSSVRKVPTPTTEAKAPTLRLDGPEGAPSVDVDPSTAVHALVQAATLPSPASRAQIQPLAPERFKVQFTMSSESCARLRRAQDLLRHSIPSGDPAAIFERALRVLVEQLEKQKIAATTHPRSPCSQSGGSRHVPAAVRREVWSRDDGRCAFTGTHGRCTERGFLEFHHLLPFAEGGETTVENLELRCRAHNAYEARLHFGPMLARERVPAYEV